MSTIEKAAERLAALKASRLNPVEDRSNHGPQPVEPVRDHVQSHRPKDVVNKFAYTDGVQLDLDMLKSTGYLTPDAGRSQLAREFRRIKRPLLLALALIVLALWAILTIWGMYS